MSPLFFIMILVISIKYSLSCNSDSFAPKFYLIEKCHRSTLGVIASANYTSLASCQKLAIEKKGVSLNFSPPEVVKFTKEGDEPVEFTCEVLKCAEADGAVSLVNDTRYDYYSIYAKNLPQVNSTCVPSIGMVSLMKRQNYSESADTCKNMSGKLVDIFSQQRTDAFSQLLAGEGRVEEAYTGARSINGSDFINVNGEKLDCTTYRAWAPGHPRRHRIKYGCVTVTKSKTWRTVSCRTKLPAFCELEPSGPYRRGSIFTKKIN